MKDIDTLREKFFSALLRRPSTSRQAREFLERSGASEEVTADLLSEAEDSGFIDDASFARLFVEGHLHWGNLKIAHELSARGVSRDAVSLVLEEAEDESKRACEIAESWRKSGLEERKIYSRLLSRGFSNRAVSSALNRKDDKY